MSSALDAVFTQGVYALQEGGHKRPFKVIAPNNAGRIFFGTLRIEPVIDPEMSLGSDPRERVWLDVLNDVDFLFSQTVIQEGRLEFGQFIGEQKWKLVSAERNPADVENKFELVKLVGDDR
jgi:hypothetical protein